MPPASRSGLLLALLLAGATAAGCATSAPGTPTVTSQAVGPQSTQLPARSGSAAGTPPGTTTGATAAAPTGVPGAASPQPTTQVAASVPPAGASSAADTQADTQIIQAVDLGNPASIEALDAIRTTAAGVAAATSLLAAHATGDALWAATYVYASSGVDPGPLRLLLAESDATVRVMAAAGLVARGDATGFEPLVQALASQDPLAGSEPPQEIWMFAASTLSRFAGPQAPDPSPDAGPDDLAANQAEWDQWLKDSGPTLRFDPASATWSAS